MRVPALLIAIVVLVLISGCAGSERASATPQPAVTPIDTPSQSPSPTSPVPSPTAASVKSGSFKLTKIAGNLRSPVYVTNAGDGSGRLFIVEQAGRILVLKNGSLLATPFLDIRSLVASGGERGLLSVAFHPDFASNGAFVVNYTRASSQPALVGDTIIARYRVSPAWADVADRASGQTQCQTSTCAPGSAGQPLVPTRATLNVMVSGTPGRAEPPDGSVVMSERFSRSSMK